MSQIGSKWGEIAVFKRREWYYSVNVQLLLINLVSSFNSEV